MSTLTNSTNHSTETFNLTKKYTHSDSIEISTAFIRFLADIEDIVKVTNFLTEDVLNKAMTELHDRIEATKRKSSSLQ